MRGLKQWMIVCAALCLTAGCTGNELDDGGSPQIVLSVTQVDNPNVTAQQVTGTQGTCSQSGTPCRVGIPGDCGQNQGTCVAQTVCVLTVENWEYTVENNPLNSLSGTPPFNNAVLNSVAISYTWSAGVMNPPAMNSIPLGAITVPADGSNTVEFPPLLQSNLNNTMQAASVILTMTFNGTTVSGTAVTSDPIGGVLNFDTCPP